MEEWRPVANYDGYYEVSNKGRVRSVPRKITALVRGKTILRKMKGKDLSEKVGAGIYKRVILCKNGVCINEYIHRIIAEAFIENPLELATVNHIDRDKMNNNLCNLEWMSRELNSKDGMENSYRLGKIKPKRVLTEKDVGHIKREYFTEQCTNISKLSRMYGVSRTTINGIINGKNWKYVE